MKTKGQKRSDREMQIYKHEVNLQNAEYIFSYVAVMIHVVNLGY